MDRPDDSGPDFEVTSTLVCDLWTYHEDQDEVFDGTLEHATALAEMLKGRVVKSEKDPIDVYVLVQQPIVDRFAYKQIMLRKGDRIRKASAVRYVLTNEYPND